MKLSIILPIFNEVNTVTELLRRVSQFPLEIEKELIIVESNSTDGTRAKVVEFVNANPLNTKLILQESPKGKGNAVREAFQYASGDIILIQDGDLEYDVKDYPALIAPIIEGRTDFVLGSRHLAAGSWQIRSFKKKPLRSLLMNFGGILFHSFFNVMYGQRLTDPTTMYKVFRRRCLRGINFESDRFDFDFELVAKLIRKGYRPLEVPITYVSRGFEEGKKIRVFKDPLTWLWAITRFRFGEI